MSHLEEVKTDQQGRPVTLADSRSSFSIGPRIAKVAREPLVNSEPLANSEASSPNNGNEEHED